jgi:hypothetical protein
MSQFNVVKFINMLPLSQDLKNELEVWAFSDDFESVPYRNLKQAIIDKAEDLQQGGFYNA